MDDQIMRHETQEAGEVRRGREIKKKKSKGIFILSQNPNLILKVEDLTIIVFLFHHIKNAQIWNMLYEICSKPFHDYLNFFNFLIFLQLTATCIPSWKVFIHMSVHYFIFFFTSGSCQRELMHVRECYKPCNVSKTVSGEIYGDFKRENSPVTVQWGGEGMHL